MVRSAEIRPVNIEDEMKDSYLDYAMSVIIGRAIPDARDGLKPVHRRILYAMLQEGLLSNKRYSKCAGVVGEVLKKYHPHGDLAVYDALVRLAQEWNMRYPLIDGQGNFGSIDGDSAAAYRYTEARLTKLAEEMLADIDKETVDFIPNFDESAEEPTVLPSRVPNLLVNGSDGIAVGMATKIPPHHLGEVIDGCLALIKNPEVTVKELMKIIPGPDFPTGGFIHGREGIKNVYETGKGSVQMRGRALIEPVAKGDRESIIITEIPYQVNKARLIERIADLHRDGKIEGISDLRDESDKDGMRIVVELKKGSVSGVVLNQLYAHTPLQTNFGVILLAIIHGKPQILNLKNALQIFVDHRKEVVTRRTIYDLRKAEERAHILEGLKIAVENIDAVINLIKKSQNPQEAKAALMKKFSLSEIQAQSILDIKLQRLTALEREKIVEEYAAVQKEIKRLKEILKSEKLLLEIISGELSEIKKNYHDERRTEIISRTEELSVEDLIQEEEMVVTISHQGYIKRNPISIYRAQRRGGQGKMASGEEIAGILTVQQFEEGKHVIFATKRGLVKKTELMAYANPRSAGIIALGVEEGDCLIGAALTSGDQEILLSTREGQAIRFHENEARPMGRTAVGVIGIRLDKKDEVVSLEALRPGQTVLSITENGYGKRTSLEEYRVQGRGGSGIITIKTTERNGPVVGVQQVTDDDHIMVITTSGKIIRLKVSELSVIGRNTQGFRLIHLEQGEKVAAFAKLAEKEGEE
ncbi:MAG: DNA topoisomerase (ATP-hydrolyzing) subunit A [Deltaproteobacteria bacterium]|nr:DNA topoisomerase (ATP-hydrolyzing) subunit A [Deltaproteobacteria bacterium]